jgi:hypothetical protein
MQDKNDGIEEHFYVPLEHYDEWNRLVLAHRLDRFRFGSTGVPLGKPKDANHEFIERKLKPG